jgi:hypothetical protein
MNFKTTHFYYNNDDENSNNKIIRIIHNQRTMPINQLKTLVLTLVATLEKTEVIGQHTVSDGLTAVHCSGPNHTLLTPRYQSVQVYPKKIAVAHTIYNYNVQR